MVDVSMPLVYKKTKQGRIAAFDAMYELPLPLKNLLRFIDGETPLGVLKKRLGDDACSDELVAQLRERVLIDNVIDVPTVLECKEQMADFVLMHLPDHAIRVLMEIQTIDSMVMLKSTLEGYGSLVKTAGPVGELHFLDIRLMVQSMEDA